MSDKRPPLTEADAKERKNKKILWASVGLGTAVMLFLLFWIADPPPPSMITIATGSKKGAYFAYGKRYAKALAKRGLKVVVINTAGTGENLELLEKGKVDIAFVQTGVVLPAEKGKRFKKLRSLAAIYTEPLWVFYRAKEAQTYLTAFKGKRVCVGAKGSGTEKVAVRLLRSNGLTPKNTRLIHCKFNQVASMMKSGKLDVAVAIASPKAKAVRSLLKNPEVRLMSFTRYRSYERQVPFVQAVRLWEGTVSLRYNIPKENVLLLAASATLAARKNTHPEVVTALLSAADEIHKAGNLVDSAGTFPSYKGLDFPLHTAAETYKHSGQGFLAKKLPFWALRLFSRLKLLLLPLLTLFLPAFRILPLLYKLRVRTLLEKHYKELRAVENNIEAGQTRAEVEAGLAELLALRDNLARVSQSIPGAYQHELYHWRLHLNLVRQNTQERLQQMAES